MQIYHIVFELTLTWPYLHALCIPSPPISILRIRHKDQLSWESRSAQRMLWLPSRVPSLPNVVQKARNRWDFSSISKTLLVPRNPRASLARGA